MSNLDSSTSDSVQSMAWLNLLVLLFCSSFAFANTETYLLKIPTYYDIPFSKQPDSLPKGSLHDVLQLNDTHSVILDFPIGSIKDQLDRRQDDVSSKNEITLTYNTKEPILKTLLVRINNYNDTTFTNDDLINVKLCWPATSAYDFRISHSYIRTNDEMALSREVPQELPRLDLYLKIEYEFFGITYDKEKYLSKDGEVGFMLYINKLPLNWLPIPLELYDFILYLVDILILVLTQFELIRRILKV